MANNGGLIIKTVIILICAHPVVSNSVMIRGESSESEQTRMMKQNVFKSFDDVTNFLRSWFQRLKSDRARNLPRPEAQSDLSSRSKRSVIVMSSGEKPEVEINTVKTNQTSFEDYEKAYLINRTMTYLMQIYFYTKYQSIKKENSINGASQTAGLGTEALALAGSEDSLHPMTSHSTSFPASVTTTDSVRTDPLLEHWLQQLGKLDIHQIANILNNARRSATLGVEAADISSLCCSMG